MERSSRPGNLGLTPLTTNSEGTDYSTHLNQQWTPRTSYIAGKSAPTTPGILSRSNSGTHLTSLPQNKGSRSYTHLAFADFSEGGRVPQARSMIGSKTEKNRKRKARAQAPPDDREWLYRAGAAIAGETRDNKGQSWLVARDSSTSLVNMDEDEDEDGAASASVPYETPSNWPRSARASRPASAKTSRRGSRAGSRLDLTASTPGKRYADAVEDDYFGRLASQRGFEGPDFVDVHDEDEGGEESDDDNSAWRKEEDEIAHLTRQSSVGLSGLVDRLIGWTLFDLTEDGAGDEERPEPSDLVSSRRRSLASQASQSSLPTGLTRTSHPGVNSLPPRPAPADSEDKEQGQGWSDAAWLLSVASKVIF